MYHLVLQGIILPFCFRVVCPLPFASRCQWQRRNATFAKPKLLHRHMKQMHMQNAHTTDCNHCGKQFSSNRVKEHIISVHGPETFGCDFCDKMFTTNFKLTSHKKYIHTERNYQLPKKLPMRCVCKTVKQPKCTQCAPVNPQ